MNCLSALPAPRTRICLFSFHQRSASKPSLGQAHPHFLILWVPSSISHGFAFSGEPLELLDTHLDSPPEIVW
jgi:hypothetical protein